MAIAVIGVNHKTCPIEMRERVAFINSKKIEGLQTLLDKGIEEAVILSTCNRSEIYIYAESIEEAAEKVIQFYMDFFCVPDIKEYIFVKKLDEAIRHLFRVTAGLDSIVIGEDQILGQVKEAQETAMENGASKKVLNKLFREAITTAKLIKSQTKISENPLSISRIAVKFLEAKEGSLKGKTALVIGTSKMNELTIKYLLEEKLDKIYVTNRNHMKAVSLADQYEGLTSIDYDKRYEVLSKVDFVISATASPHIILKAEHIRPLHKTVYMMDIAMPRDIDPAIDTLPYAHVYDIDDLKAISETNTTKRIELAHYAEKIIDERMKKLKEWMGNLKIDPIVRALSERCEVIKNHTLEYIDKKVELEEKEKEILEKQIECALKRIVREPIVKLKETEDKAKQETYIAAIKELFELNI